MPKKEVSLGVKITNGIIEVFRSGLEAWRTYLATRQQAYERYLDKKQEKAIQIAEEAFNELIDLNHWISNNIPMDDEQSKEFKKRSKKIEKLRNKFDKFD